jgi:geranylgeranyl reductase family protein
MSLDSDVLIVGGGHVGLYTAAQLAQKGFRVHLFDQKRAIGERVVCTGIIGNEAFERFNLPTDLILGQIQQVRFFSPFGNFFDYSPSAPLARVVDRGRFNQYFAHLAQSCGVKIETSASVEAVHVQPDRVTVEVAGPEAGKSSYEAKLLILATGVNHKLFQEAGITPSQNFVGAAQVHLPYKGETRTSIYVGRKIAPGAFAWVVPLENGSARVGLLSEENPRAYLKRFLDRVTPGWQDKVKESEIDLRPIVARPLKKSFADRVLVVGEAAGQIKTTTGGGIYYGFRGAEIAIGTVQEAFRRNRFDGEVLSDYDLQWKRDLGEELRLGYYCRKLFAKFSDEYMEELFNDQGVREEILNLVYRQAEFDWHRGLVLSMLRLPRVALQAVKHPFLALELFSNLLWGRV